METDGRTDGQTVKLIVDFRNFSKAPKLYWTGYKKHKRPFLGPWNGAVSTATGMTLNRLWCNRNKKQKIKATILDSVQYKEHRRPSDQGVSFL